MKKCSKFWALSNIALEMRALRTTMASAALLMCLIASTGINSAEGIRRHHRHRRDPDPVGEERVQKPNLYKPKFEDCETYDPTVEEGSRKGKTQEPPPPSTLLSFQGAASGDSTPGLLFLLHHHLTS